MKIQFMCVSILFSTPLLAADFKVFRSMDLGAGYHAEILRDKALDAADKSEGVDPDSHGAYANAKFIVIGPAKKTVFRQELDRPLADLLPLSAKPPSTKGQLFWVMTDFSCGFGSFCGPAYQLGQFQDGNFQWVQAKTCEGKPIQLKVSSTMKTGWRVEPNGDILEIACRPYGGDKEPISDEVKFFVYHIRWHWDGNTWRFFERWGEGYWEDEEYGTGESRVLGPEAAFPKACEAGQKAEPFWGK